MKTIPWLACFLALPLALRAQSPDLKSDPVPGPNAVSPPPLAPAAQARIAAMTPIFDGRTLAGWLLGMKGTNSMDLSEAWTARNGVLASRGAGRGVIYTSGEYEKYRVIFKVRHVSGQPDHQACVLIFCTPPGASGATLDALAGIQFQPPNGGSWDYRPGKNNSGNGLFTRSPHPKFDPHEWSQVELWVDAGTGTARMAVAQPPGTRAFEVLAFHDPAAGRKGPFALQMHNKGLFDEYQDLRIEVNPKSDRLITTD